MTSEVWISITGGAGTAFPCVQWHFHHWLSVCLSVCLDVISEQRLGQVRWHIWRGTENIVRQIVKQKKWQIFCFSWKKCSNEVYQHGLSDNFEAYEIVVVGYRPTGERQTGGEKHKTVHYWPKGSLTSLFFLETNIQIQYLYPGCLTIFRKRLNLLDPTLSRMPPPARPPSLTSTSYDLVL